MLGKENENGTLEFWDSRTFSSSEEEKESLSRKKKMSKVSKMQDGTIESSALMSLLEYKPDTLIHPALDFTETTAYVGLHLPFRDLDKKLKHILYLVTETEMFPANPEELSKRKIELLHSFPYKQEYQSRWSNESIRQFTKDRKTLNPKDLYEAVKGPFSEYIDFQDPRYYDLVTLWSIGTYFFPLFDAYPYLFLNGISDSGKTQVMKICQCVCFNAKHVGNITVSILFREIHTSRCTYLLDEEEELANSQGNEELKQLLLNGYKRGPMVSRSDMSSSEFPPKFYEIYAPKALGNIGGLESTLESRAITVLMQPTSRKEIVGKKIAERKQRWQSIRDMEYVFLFQEWRTIKKSYEEIENEAGLNNREWELWQPVLALARLFSEDTYKRMLELAVEKAEERKVDKSFSPEAELCEALLAIVDKDDLYGLGRIKEHIIWKYDNKVPSWITEKHISHLLKKFGFPKPTRYSNGYKYYLTLSKVKDLAHRYGVVDEHSEHSERPTEG